MKALTAPNRFLVFSIIDSLMARQRQGLFWLSSQKMLLIASESSDEHAIRVPIRICSISGRREGSSESDDSFCHSSCHTNRIRYSWSYWSVFHPPDPVTLVKIDMIVAQALFNITFCYFPISFKPPTHDPYGISPDDLKLALRWVCPHQAAFVKLNPAIYRPGHAFVRHPCLGLSLFPCTWRSWWLGLLSQR